MPVGDRLKDENVRHMLSVRMGWNVGDPVNPFARLMCFALNQEQVAVIVVRDGKLTTIYDEVGLFPSDALVTQLRILGS